MRQARKRQRSTLGSGCKYSPLSPLAAADSSLMSITNDSVKAGEVSGKNLAWQANAMPNPSAPRELSLEEKAGVDEDPMSESSDLRR